MSKVKVYELAKELGKDSKDVVKFLEGKNIEVKNHMSTISEDEAAMVKKALGGSKAPEMCIRDSPRFEGQTKTKLDNPDAAKATGKVTGEEVVRYFDRNLDTLKKVLALSLIHILQ